MKFLGMLSLLFILSCGKSGNNSGAERSVQSEDGYSCQSNSLTCLEKSDWFIISSRPFPKNFSIHLIMVAEGHEYVDEVMNTCRRSKVDYDHSTPRKSTAHFISSYRIPENMAVRLDIRSLGEACERDDVFFAGFVPMVQIESGTGMHYRQTLELQNSRVPDHHLN